MKFLKSILVLFMSFIVMSASSQTVSANAYLGTNSTHLLGGDLLVTLKSGVVFGVGGSHATKTFFTSEKRNGNDYTDNCNNRVSNFPKLSDPANASRIRETFIENRGTVNALIGYSFKNTIILSEFGVGLQQEIKLATTGFLTDPVTPLSSNYWESNTVGPKFLYGMTVTQNFGGRFGVMLGYNNIQSLKFGLSYKITPTSMFKD